MRRFSAVGLFALGVTVSLCGCQGVVETGTSASSRPNNAAAASPADIEQGMTIAQSKGCSGCHSSQAGQFAGAGTGIGGHPVFGPNLTPDMETGVGGWTDQDLITAIRYGIDDAGGTLCSEMPRYQDLTDADAAKLVAYLRSLTPIAHTVKESACTPSQADVALHGQMVARDNGCMGCHGQNLSGASGPNLTPDEDTGIGSWSTEQITTAVKTGIDDEGAMLCSTMPRFVMLNDEELEAVAAYLKSLPAVAHEVEVTCNDPDMPTEDAGVDPVVEDAGTVEVDAGTAMTAIDAGTRSVDAGVPHDAGTAHDAGLPMFDAGTPAVDAGMPATCGGAEVVISEVYGAGGNAGSLFKADYVELHNRTGHAVSIGGWSLQYASSAGSNWTAAAIPTGTTLAPGAFALFTVSPVGTNGAVLPGTPIALSPALNLAAATGKVALTNSAMALTGACPSSTALIDFVGYGGTNCSEGSQPTAVLSATTSATRREAALSCSDSDVNSADFVIAAPAPHLAPASCGCP